MRNADLVTTSVDPLDGVLGRLGEAAARHHEAADERVLAFVREVEVLYADEVREFVSEYACDPDLGRVLEPVLDETSDYLLWLRWVGWNVANLAPVLHADPGPAAARLAPAMLAYAGLRLIDDGLDDHRSFKGHRRTVVGFLHERGDAAAGRAGVYSAFLGFCVFTHALRRIGPAGREPLDRLFAALSVGVLAEGLLDSATELQIYEPIVRRKSGAYNLILYKPVLEGVEESLRLRLLGALAEMDSLAQLINDFNDAADDETRAQINAFNLFEPVQAREEATRRLELLHAESLTLPVEVGDALSAMLLNLGAGDLT